MTPEQVGSGMVDGGWSFVWWAYGVSWMALAGYVISLWFRSRDVEDS